MKTLDKVLDTMFTAEERADIRRRAQEKIAGLRLVRLREEQSMTQEETAKAMGISQAALSKMEHRSNITMGALQRYVEAIGGKLEVTVLLPKSPQRREKGAGQKRLPVRRVPLVHA